MRTFCIVTCKGRLDFLKQTAPTVLAQRRATYLLVDYSCPQSCGDWLQAEHGDEADVAVARVPFRERFHKTHANNAGACEAVRQGATHLLFADADTLFAPESLATIGALLRPGYFVVAGRTHDGRNVRSLTGFIGLSAEDFVLSAGYDEGFVDWGAEDVEFRLRLYFERKLLPMEVPFGCLEPIAHGDELRTAHHHQKDLRVSLRSNNERLRKKLIAWSGQGFEHQTGPVARLLFGQR